MEGQPQRPRGRGVRGANGGNHIGRQPAECRIDAVDPVPCEVAEGQRLHAGAFGRGEGIAAMASVLLRREP